MRDCHFITSFTYPADVLALAAAIGELTTHTRRARTAQWCALQSASRDVPAHCVHSAEAAITKPPDTTLGQASPQLSARATMGPVCDAGSQTPSDVPTDTT